MLTSIVQDIDSFLLLNSHPSLKNFYYLQDKSSYETFLCKILEYKSHSIFLKLIQEYDYFFKCSHSKIVQFHGICERINPINNNFQFFLLYEKMERNLKDIVLEKRKNSVFFSKIEMKCFVSNIFEALAYLQRTFNKANNNLKPENVLLSHNGSVFKLTDIGLRNMRANIYPNKYIPPNIKKNSDYLYQGYDFDNYDIFAFGVLIMEVGSLGFLGEEENIYENNEMIKLGLLQEIKERYGNSLRELVEMFLGNQGLNLLKFKDCRGKFQEYMVIIRKN